MENVKVNSTLLKDVNRKKILSVVDNAGRISRVEVQALLKKNGKTVTNITNSLIEDGLIVSSGFSSYTGGRRRELLSINSEYGYLIGIHLGVKFLRGTITNFNYTILAEEKIPISPNASKADLLKVIKKTIAFLLNSNKIPSGKLLGIGFVANGLFDYKTGEWLISANIKNWKNIHIKKILSELYNVPVFQEINSRAMTLWEKHLGNAKNKKNFIYLNLGIGIGCGIINNGRIYRGVNNKAGELGHTIVVPNGESCSCGNRGCLETVASGWALKKIIKRKILDGKESEITDLCNDNLDLLDIDMISKAFNNGDKLVTEVLETASDYLGIGIANFINLFNPEVVVIGGKFAMFGDLFLNRLKKNIKKYAMPLLFNEVTFITSCYNDNIASIGATTLVRDSYFHIGSIS